MKKEVPKGALVYFHCLAPDKKVLPRRKDYGGFPRIHKVPKNQTNQIQSNKTQINLSFEINFEVNLSWSALG